MELSKELNTEKSKTEDRILEHNAAEVTGKICAPFDDCTAI
jgi:hypothetical protein